MPKNITVTIFGPSRVGKTTLLASMYYELTRRSNLPRELHVACEDPNRRVELANKRDAIESELEKGLVFSPFTGAYESTEGIIRYPFSVRYAYDELAKVTFVDHRGGIMDVNVESADLNELDVILRGTNILMNVIDATVLMETPELSNRFNRHTLIGELLDSALRNDREHLVLFILTKCEKWVKDGYNSSSYKGLLRRFEEYHRNAIDAVERYRFSSVGVFMPVQTLGCVVFSRCEGRGDNIKYIFSKVEGRYNPVDVEQPLYYALYFSLREADKGRDILGKLLGFLSGKNEKYRYAQKLLRDRMNRDSFRIYGNSALLE